MIVAKRLKGKAIAALLGPTGQKARTALSRARSDGPLAYYFDIEDPWSYLGAQVLARLVAAYGVPFEIHSVSRPASDVTPSLLQRDAYSVRDCQELAAYYDLEFPGRKTADPGIAVRAASGLIRPTLTPEERLTATLEMGKALWSGDGKTVATVLGRTGSESTVAVPPKLAAAYALQRKRGHYQGAMVWYRGEWYHAIDRLSYLEAELARDTGKPVAGVLKVRPEAERGPLLLATDKNKPVLALEMWISYRSPYSYLALEQLARGFDLHGVPLVLKPIAPMVNRGHVLVSDKRTYILADAKREADRLGVPFGEICDPLGKGVAACLAISHHLAKQGDGAALMEFARSALRGAWSEARDLAEYVDLRAVVERAGLPWSEVTRWVSDPAGQSTATANATDLEAIGMWGVPSFRIGDLWLWGQDRLPILQDRLRRHGLAAANKAAEAAAAADSAPTDAAAPTP
jgi:2-hydroxychromene-2-carboxylate isomerase